MAFAARNPSAAARTAVPILLVCAAAIIALTWTGSAAQVPVAVVASWCGAGVLVLLAGAYAAFPPARLDRVGAFLLTAVIGVVVACALNLVTRDHSAAAQAFLSFPVLWGGLHLRRAAAGLVTGLALVLDAAVLFQLEEPVAASTDVLAFGAVLITACVMLVRSGDGQERLVALLQQQATSDSLTGLVNRRVLDEALSAALGDRDTGPGTALVLLDIDSFKTVNDQHGHPVGDDALVHIAGVLRSVVRAGDAVLSRMGGDELAVLLPRCPSDVAVRRAGEVLDAVRSQPLPLPDGGLLALSLSLGVAHAPTHADGLEELYAAADAALYAAKRAGRGRVEVARVR